MTKRTKQLVPLYPNEVDPRVFLEEMLENADSFKSVMVVIQYRDETFSCDWSKMTTAEVAMACVVLDSQMRDCILDRAKEAL